MVAAPSRSVHTSAQAFQEGGLVASVKSKRLPCWRLARVRSEMSAFGSTGMFSERADAQNHSVCSKAGMTSSEIWQLKKKNGKHGLSMFAPCLVCSRIKHPLLPKALFQYQTSRLKPTKSFELHATLLGGDPSALPYCMLQLCPPRYSRLLPFTRTIDLQPLCIVSSFNHSLLFHADFDSECQIKVRFRKSVAEANFASMPQDFYIAPCRRITTQHVVARKLVKVCTLLQAT